MKRLHLLFVVLMVAALVTAPPVGSAKTPAPDVREWRQHITTLPPPPGGNTNTLAIPNTTFVVDYPHSLQHVNGTSIILVDAWVQFRSPALGEDRARWEVHIDGVLYDDCEWKLRRTSAEGHVQESDFRVWCPANAFLEEGAHSFQFVQTIEAGGSPVDRARADVILFQIQEVEEPMTNFETATGLTALEFLVFPIVAVIGVIVWSRSTDPVARFFGGILSVVVGALLLAVGAQAGLGDIWVGTIPLAASLILVGGYLNVRMFIDGMGGPG